MDNNNKSNNVFNGSDYGTVYLVSHLLSVANSEVAIINMFVTANS